MNKRILLADDSLTIQKVVELTFMDESFDVEAVSGGEEAIESLGTALPDILIADVHMPGPSGYEVCRRAKETSSTLPVLLLVGTFEALDDDEMEACGADGHLKKPFDSQELLQVVQKMTSGASPVAEAAASPDAGEPEEAAEADAPAAGFDLGALAESEAEVDIGEIDLGDSIDLDFAEDATSEATPEPEDPLEVEGLEGSGHELPSSEEAVPEETQPEEATDVAAAELDDAVSGGPGDPTDAGGPGDGEPPVSGGPGDVPPTGSEEAAGVPTTDWDLGAAAPPITEEGPAGNGASDEASGDGSLSDEDVERVARRVVELLSDQTIREVAWDVIPDMAEIVIKDRIRELEAEAE